MPARFQRNVVAAVAAVCAFLFTVLAAAGLHPVPQPVLAGGTLQFDGAAAMANTKALAQGYPDRVTGTRGSRRAARFIGERFEALGYRVTIQRFPLWAYGKRVTGENVIARSRDARSASPYVAVLAHYDNPVTAHQAAEDDGSGIGTILELARVLRGRAKNAMFIATDAEEFGMIGARNAAPWLRERGRGTALAIDYVNAGAANGLQLTASGQFGGYAPVALRQLARAAAEQQTRSVRYPYGIAEWIERAVDRSFQDQGPLLAAGIPAVNLTTLPADLASARERYHTPRDAFANFKPAVFSMVGRTAERTILSLARGLDAGADGLMIAPDFYLSYRVLWIVMFLPLVPVLVAAAFCWAPARTASAWRIVAFAVPAFGAYALVRAFATFGIIPRFELYPPPPKDPFLSHPPAAVAAALLVTLLGGCALAIRMRVPLFGKRSLLVWTAALAAAAFAINPFGFWLYLGLFTAAAMLFSERGDGRALALDLTTLVLAALPFSAILWYFAHEIFVGGYIWWYLVLQAAYGTWQPWVVGTAIVAVVLWTQYLRLALAPLNWPQASKARASSWSRRRSLRRASGR